MTIVYLKLPEVQRRTQKGKTQIYRDMKNGDFPRQVRNGKKGVVWVESEIIAWQESNNNHRNEVSNYQQVARISSTAANAIGVNDTFNFN